MAARVIEIPSHFLDSLGVAEWVDFYTLSASQVCTVLEYADAAKYRKPRNANGSRGRYFYERMRRAARRG